MCFRAGFFGVDEFRYGIEQMHPAGVPASLRTNEHWLHTVEHHGRAKGLLSPDDWPSSTPDAIVYLEHPDEPLPQRDDPGLIAFVERWSGRGSRRPGVGQGPRFKAGDMVTVLGRQPGRPHPPRPLYRGRTGEIAARARHLHLPGQRGQRRGDAPEHVYTVKFTNAELWGLAPPSRTASSTSTSGSRYITPLTRPERSMSEHVRSQAEIAARVKALGRS